METCWLKEFDELEACNWLWKKTQKELREIHGIEERMEILDQLITFGKCDYYGTSSAYDSRGGGLEERERGRAYKAMSRPKHSHSDQLSIVDSRRSLVASDIGLKENALLIFLIDGVACEGWHKTMAIIPERKTSRRGRVGEGRPTKRTPEVVAKIAEAVAIGLTDREAGFSPGSAMTR